LPEFAGVRRVMNGIEAFKFEPQIYKPLAINDAIHRFVNARQAKNVSVAEYLEQFQNNLDVLEAVGATVGPHSGVITMITEGQAATPDQLCDAKERSVAVAFINKADQSRYGRLLEDLRNNYLMGQDNYPRNLNQAYNLLVNTLGPGQTMVSCSLTRAMKKNRPMMTKVPRRCKMQRSKGKLAGATSRVSSAWRRDITSCNARK
jgi:hypothetical protein